MEELIAMKQVLTEYLNEQEEISDRYNIDNDGYRNGLYDAIRLIDQTINKRFEEMVSYYEDTKE